QLTAELELLDQLAAAAEPLLAPGVSLKALKDDLAKTDAAVAEVCGALGLEPGKLDALPSDYQKPVEALSRLEATARLIRAMDGARKHCTNKLEPVFRRYLAAAEGSLAGDRPVIAELTNCLAALSLREKLP